MSRFLADAYQKLEAYTPGEQPRDMAYIKLNTNESPYPPHEAVVKAATEESGKLHLYCDPECTALTAALAERYKVSKKNVFTANGSDDILNFAFMAWAGRGKTACYPDITYGFYKVFAELHGCQSVIVPLRDDFSVALSDYDACHGLIVLANPNAPTGMALTRHQLEGLVASHPDDVVLIDEAYVDFGAESCVPLIENYGNLIVTQTFSKSRGLAGGRLGFALANEALIDDLNRLKYSTNPYNVNRMTQAAGAAALSVDQWYMDNCRRVMETREWTANELHDLGFDVTHSLANFLFVRSDRVSGEDLYRQLRKKGILVRHFTGPRICDYNRITIGTPEQMNSLIVAVRDILEGK